MTDQDAQKSLQDQEHLQVPACMNASRRRLLGQMVLGGVGVAGTGLALQNLMQEEVVLAAQLAGETSAAAAGDGAQHDALSGATRAHTDWSKLTDLKKPVTKGKIAGLPVSRMILGGNLIAGFAHSRDLLYPSDLVKAYHTKEKVFATYKLAEACGVNTTLGNWAQIHLCEEYWKKHNGSIQFFANCNTVEEVNICAEKGAVSCYIHGGHLDRLVEAENFDEIERRFRAIEKHGVIAGLGAHFLHTVTECHRRGYRPAYWLKTIHHHNYPSAKNVEAIKKNKFYSIFCYEPDETTAFMDSLDIPWVGFKTLAAGAILPQDGFRFAFERGADFLCVGIYDFQVVDDVNICMEILDSPLERKRPWIAS